MTKKIRQLPAGEGSRWPHVLVRFYAASTNQPCFCMANLPVLQQPIKVLSTDTLWWSVSTSGFCPASRNALIY